MNPEIRGLGGYSPYAGPGGGADPRTQARQLQKEVDTLLQQTHLRMQVDLDAGCIVVQVIDAASGDLLRQIPREEALRLARETAERARKPRG